MQEWKAGFGKDNPGAMEAQEGYFLQKEAICFEPGGKGLFL